MTTADAGLVDRAAVHTAAQLLAKADRTAHDPEALAFLRGTYRLLGRMLASPSSGVAAPLARAQLAYGIDRCGVTPRPALDLRI